MKIFPPRAYDIILMYLYYHLNTDCISIHDNIINNDDDNNRTDSLIMMVMVITQ